MFQTSHIHLGNQSHVCYLQPMRIDKNHHIILVDMDGFFLCGVRHKIVEGDSGHIHFFVYASIEKTPKKPHDKDIEHLFSVLTYAITAFFEQTVASIEMKDQITLRLSKHCAVESHVLQYDELISSNVPVTPMKIKLNQITNFKLEIYVAGTLANNYVIPVEKTRDVNSELFIYSHILNNKLTLRQFLDLNKDDIKASIIYHLINRREELTNEFMTLGKQLAALKQIH